MKYVTAFPPSRGPRRLEAGATRERVGNDCREAALTFMAGVAGGWDKLDLALWLTGPYARATRHAKRGERDIVVDGDAEELSENDVKELVARVRGQLLASLEKAALEYGTLDFAEEARERGLVRQMVDDEGRDVWIPVDAPRMRLRDRVRSLFAADYLDTPYAYAELFVCHRCEAVVFDEAAKRVGVCGAHRISGVVPREDSPAPGGVESPVEVDLDGDLAAG